jgi:hypothetical protein
MKYYDAHIHFFYNCPTDELKRIFKALENIGLAGMDVLVISEFPPEIETVLKMIPGAYHRYASLQVFENQKDPFPAFHLTNQLKIIPFLDARFIEDQIEPKVRMFYQKGFKGLKLLYVPEEDLEYRIGGMEKTFRRTRKKSEEITALLIKNASTYGMTILMHADLRKHGEFVAEMMNAHLQTHFNIPHFGFSRKAMSTLLDRYPNCYTDISSLRIFMEKDPESYQNFIQPENIQSALKFLEGFLGNREIFFKLVNENYLNFHGLSSGT